MPNGEFQILGEFGHAGTSCIAGKLANAGPFFRLISGLLSVELRDLAKGTCSRADGVFASAQWAILELARQGI
jgi:hypothetical protein